MSSGPDRKGPGDYQVRGINRWRAQAIYRFGASSILDVGCGSGAYVLGLTDDREITGVDIAAYPGWASQPERFACADATQLPFADGSFGTVTAFEVLEHLEDPVAALGEFARVCSRNIIITVPNCTTTNGMRRSGVAYHHWTDRTHRNFWDRNGIARFISDCGFNVVAVQPINYVNLGHLFAESICLRGALAAIAARVFRLTQLRRYPMTTLVVAVPSRLANLSAHVSGSVMTQ